MTARKTHPPHHPRVAKESQDLEQILRGLRVAIDAQSDVALNRRDEALAQHAVAGALQSLASEVEKATAALERYTDELVKARRRA